MLLVTGALSLVWDLHGRRRLTDELLVAAGIQRTISDAGLKRVTVDYGDIDWDGLINGATHADLFFTYARTWRNNHETALRDLLGRDGSRLRIVLADREDEALMAHLAIRFKTSPEDVAQRIEEAERAWAQLALGKAQSAALELRVTAAPPVFTYYRFDGRCVGVFYGQAGERVDVPALECERGGTLYAFFDGQFESLWAGASARPVE